MLSNIIFIKINSDCMILLLPIPSIPYSIMSKLQLHCSLSLIRTIFNWGSDLWEAMVDGWVSGQTDKQMDRWMSRSVAPGFLGSEDHCSVRTEAGGCGRLDRFWFCPCRDQSLTGCRISEIKTLSESLAGTLRMKERRLRRPFAFLSGTYARKGSCPEHQPSGFWPGSLG